MTFGPKRPIYPKRDLNQSLTWPLSQCKIEKKIKKDLELCGRVIFITVTIQLC